LSEFVAETKTYCFATESITLGITGIFLKFLVSLTFTGYLLVFTGNGDENLFTLGFLFVEIKFDFSFGLGDFEIELEDEEDDEEDDDEDPEEDDDDDDDEEEDRLTVTLLEFERLNLLDF